MVTWSREELNTSVSEALEKRNRKEHKCLTQKTAEETDEDENLFSASETQEKIASGELNAAQNLVKLSKRCRRYGRNNSANTAVNAITEEFYDEAYSQALKIDSTSSKTGTNQPSLLLQGVPISVKDCIAMKGALATCGLACRTFEKHRCTEDGVLVKILREHCGALPIVRGNVGQLMMLPQAHNQIWGTTRNPWDLSRVPGGSSGGDSALVAMKCVPLALGTDVAGSIRIPAAYNGIVGFKPTSTRLSTKGNPAPRKNNQVGTKLIIPVAIGPIARSVDDCALFMKSVCVPEMSKLDCSIAPTTFNQEIYDDTRPLRFGYFLTDGWFEPCSAAKRALTETVDRLKDAGHVCVPFDVPTDGWQNYGLLVAINAADGNMRAYTEALEGETMIDSYNTLYRASNLPNFLRPIVSKLLDKRRGHLIGQSRSGGLNVHDYWQKCAELAIMRDKWQDAMKDANIDVILHPTLPTPAIFHDMVGDFLASYTYTFIASLLLWPSGTVPVTTVKEDEQEYNLEDIPENQRDQFAYLASNVMKGSKGLPINISAMTPSFQDELCLRAMKEIERCARFDAEPQAYKNFTSG